MRESREILKYLKYAFQNEKDPYYKPEPDGLSITFPYPCNDTSKCSPYRVTIQPGYYRFELWGAQGGDGRYVNEYTIRKDSGGKGAYASGNIYIDKERVFYLYIGGRGGDNWQVTKQSHGIGGYNGGQDGGADLNDTGIEPGDNPGPRIPDSSAGGGGATDIRLIEGNSTEALVSRIIIAAGGGGGASTNGGDNWSFNYRGGHGGGLNSSVFAGIISGANQTGCVFGQGSSPLSINVIPPNIYTGGCIGGGGGGYYGGCVHDEKYYVNFSASELTIGGPGGSSYISGHPGCMSVQLTDAGELEHIDSPYHNSGLVFKNTTIVDGSIEKHSDSGLIKITLLSPAITNQYPIHYSGDPRFSYHLYF